MGMKKKTNENVLRACNLSVKLGGRIILEKINLEVKEGEILGIVGVSGIGKTTLLRSIIAFYPIMNNAILYKSTRTKKLVSVPENLDQFKKLFGFSAQTPSFYPDLSVLENLEYFASLYDIPKDVKKQNINKVLELVQLKNFVSLSARNLSGGMKKRLDIACALVHNPKILILDEPTSDIDPSLRVHLWNLMENINKNGTTIIVASHFLSEIEHTCDRIIFLNNKHVEFTGTPKEFRNLYSKIREVHISTKDGIYNPILKKSKEIPFFEVKHVFKKKGSIVLHTKLNEREIKKSISKILHNEKNISDIEIKSPSMDTLFRLFTEK